MLSIIIPCYNIEKYINDCLNSLHEQTSQDFQLILVNDASTDGTSEKIKGYPFIKDFKDVNIVELPENKGVSNARNVGMSKIRGGYYIFVDGDDRLESDAVETINALTRENKDVDVIGYDACLCGNLGEKSELKLGTDNLKEQIGMAIRGYWSVVWRFAYNTNFMRANNFMFDTSLIGGEDYLFVCQTLSKAKTFQKIDKQLYDYATDHEGSAMARINLKGLNDQFKATDKVAELINNNVSLKAFTKDLNYRYLYIKKLFFKTSLKIWRSWNPQSNNFVYGDSWRVKDKLVFKIISFLSKGL